MNAIELIAKYEGCNLKAYKCPAGIWTIGYGHTGDNVKEGVIISKGEADILLEKEVAKIRDQINCLLKVPLKENQIEALISLTYNVGMGAFKRSKLLKRINNSEDLELISKEWIEFNKVNGKTVKGLLKRRTEEILIFLS